MDYKAGLLDSLEKNASEKSGIIKKNTALVLYLTSDKVYNTIMR
jgi:folylpolyglutamate synthase/dihydropteroate synthase